MEPPVKPWVVTHVPLHQVRHRQRGFDQAEIIAREVGEIYGVPVVPLLERVRKTAPQARREARQVGEMDEVFTVVSGIEVPKFVLLCDDVFTSGATMDAAAKALKEAGAEMVWGFVLGKGA
jgi:predicted amidophosphoribosyltransferase